MTQKVDVVLEDDLEGGPADETVRFGIGSVVYEIDLNAKNAAAFRGQLTPFVEHARLVQRGPHRQPARTVASRRRSGEIRVWAKENGFVIRERGRLPASVVSQYHAAGQ
jgi:nucleoid-associated protein Lsr2